MVAAAWVALVFVVVAAFVPSFPRVPVRRLVLGIVVGVCLVFVLLHFRKEIPPETTKDSDLVIMMVCFPVAACLGFILGSAVGDKVMKLRGRAPGVATLFIHPLITIVLGGLFFGSAWYITLYYLNPYYLKVMTET